MVEQKEATVPDDGEGRLTRRDFMKRAGTAGAVAAAVSPVVFMGGCSAAPEDVNVALIGPGTQGRILMMNCLKIRGVHFKAVCDIWEYHRRYAGNILKKFKQPVNAYTDYREMLAKEKDLDAVIIATPDWVHAEQTIACLEAGKHVYCESEMSNSVERCREMVRAARRTGKLLQIGRQRRSNARYIRADVLMHKDRILGRITHAHGQWHRWRRLNHPLPPEKYMISEAVLRKYGYDTMERFRNWRWFRKFSGGPMAESGGHQVDVFNWFLRARPTSVMATGGLDYYKRGESYDNIMALYDYDTPEGKVRCFYRDLFTTSHGDYFETFMGDQGSLTISEDARVGFFHPEAKAEPAGSPGKSGVEIPLGQAVQVVKAREKTPEELKAEADEKKPVHMLHLENFFNAIRGKAEFTCPAEEAFATAVPILKTNEAVAARRQIALTAADYEV